MRGGYGDYVMGPGMMGGYGYGYGDIFMGIFYLILLGVAIYFIVQSVRSKSGVGQASESHIDILKKRYAKGKITKEDFDRMKNELK
jgi:putative membrane protein